MTKTAIITGASSGLGKAVVELLSENNWHVFALARNIDKINFDGNVTKISCDIRNLSDIDEAFLKIGIKTKTIDLLVNCAGRALTKSFETTSREEMVDVLGVNLNGNIYVAHEVYKRMVSQKKGQIINVGSTSSIKARDNETLYCASKWGLRGFTESLRLEAKQHGIKVTGVYPGGMQSSNFWKRNPDKDISAYMPSEAVAKQIVAVINEDDETHTSEVIIERP
ncbi:SDR family oxidoreductase [Candidatus Woesebacteria bacterium]|nr:SDR family oxidoreductase [Candidatus Woesebacteria bacterium]